MPNYSNRGLSPSMRTNCKPGEQNQFFLKNDASILEVFTRQYKNEKNPKEEYHE